MDLIYLDYNCFQGIFDNSSQIRIQLEALACQEMELFNWAELQRFQFLSNTTVCSSRLSKVSSQMDEKLALSLYLFCPFLDPELRLIRLYDVRRSPQQSGHQLQC